MKALILAAGLGTRLRPHTLYRPKPLFPLAGVPLLEIWIHRLAAAGCTAVAVNGHWHQDMIARFLGETDWPVPVLFRPEPELLGTGGAIRNFSDFWDDAPFFVVNSDAAVDTDLSALFQDHTVSGGAATLLLCDDPRANTVSLDPKGRITGFSGPGADETLRYCFTGIQVLSPDILSFLPPGPSSSIRAFERMMKDGHEIKGRLMPSDDWWMDIGAPDRYRQASLKALAAFALSGPVFGSSAHLVRPSSTEIMPLAGDGSDRRWYRATASEDSVILADHGDWGFSENPDGKKTKQRECDAFMDIGRHLHMAGLAVPRILREDRYTGMAAVMDLGDRSLQQACEELRASANGGWDEAAALYRDVIDSAWQFHIRGKEGFDPEWCWQTREMDAEMIRDAECGYFVRAFVRNFAGYAGPAPEVELDRLARRIGALPRDGIIHRDCQSRNIMIHDGQPFFIDFQGARPGPFAYDLASLLIDPYVELPPEVQEDLLEYAASQIIPEGPAMEEFQQGYRYCALSRNLQMLGAFAFLSREKGKTGFAGYIPIALNGLADRSRTMGDEFPELHDLALRLRDHLFPGGS